MSKPKRVNAEPKKTGDQEIGKSKSKFRRRIFNISVKLVKINVSRPRIQLSYGLKH